MLFQRFLLFVHNCVAWFDFCTSLQLQCTEDTYTGNGILCGVDSDSDGFPDGQLDCTDQRCEQVCTLYNLPKI